VFALGCMERFVRTTNQTKAVQVRKEILDGREHWVVPMVMLVEGVHNGSLGPIYYPASELAKVPAVWNHKPIVVDHPVWNGVPVSACEPVILNARKVGVILNTRWEEGKLKAEAWIDPIKAKQVDARIIEAIVNQKVMELSTGLFLEEEPISGTWNGESYQSIARNLRPDHLALLPDGVGACSVADGAGFIRNAAVVEVKLKKGEDVQNREEAQRWGRQVGFHWDRLQEDAEEFRFQREGFVWNQQSKRQEVKLNERCTVMLASLETSLSQRFDAVAQAIREKFGNDAWMVDLFEDRVIYGVGDRLFQVSYTISEDGKVTFGNETVEVKKEVTYRVLAVMKKEADGEHPASHYLVVEDPEKPSTWHLRVRDVNGNLDHRLMGAAWAALHKGFRGNKYEGPKKEEAIRKLKALYKQEGMDLPSENSEEERNSMKEKLIAEILAANSVWKEEDREQLMALEESVIQKIRDSLAPSRTPEPPKPPASVEEYIAAAPEGMREVLANGFKAYQAKKQETIKTILANRRNPFTEEELKAKDLDELERLAQLAAPEPDYRGQAPVNQSKKEEEPLVVPRLDFKKN